MQEVIRKVMQYQYEQPDREELIALLLRNQEKAALALLRMLEAVDRGLYAHSLHVTQIGMQIAGAMQLSEQQTEYVKLGGLLHDIGKIAIHDNILYKKGKLNVREFREIKNHPAVGATILQKLEFAKHICDIVQQHHERMDGRGYPAGFAGADIRVEARIIAIADSYDALVADRVYRKGMPQAEAVAILREGSGDHYDADILEVFTTRVLGLNDELSLSVG